MYSYIIVHVLCTNALVGIKHVINYRRPMIQL